MIISFARVSWVVPFALLALHGSLLAEQTGPARRVLAADDSKRRLAIVAPDGSVEWEYTLAWVTRVERLPNGNTRFGNCHAGPDNPQFIEVTPNKEVVWTFKDFTLFGNSTPVQVVVEP